MKRFIISSDDVGGYIFECDGSDAAIEAEKIRFREWAWVSGEVILRLDQIVVFPRNS